MRICVGSDEATSLTRAVLEDLKGRGHTLTLVGPLAGEAALWPQVAREVAEAVASGQADAGLLFCWTGTGVSIAANKVPGVRAALCADAETARGARLWNNANVLCLSLRSTSEALAREILEAWFATDYQPNEEDDACLKEVEEIERRSLARSGQQAGRSGRARP
jgi:ribose 5-phosphate isomerase B